MKNIALILVLSFLGLSAFAQHEHHQKADTATAAPKPKSPKMSAMAFVGKNHVHIDYSSPSVRNRVIWNGLVAYNQVWVAGAHKATSVEFSQDVMINGTLVTKGKYGFFAIPNKDKWTLILNKDWDMHLADKYNKENDVLRVDVKPAKNKNMVESLTYEVIANTKKNGSIKLSWENLNVSLSFENQ